MRVLVTGSAGFIGFHVSGALLDAGHEVVGVDNLSPYYDVGLKRARLGRLTVRDGYRHIPLDIADRDSIEQLFRTERPHRVVNLAAQAGVRYSLTDPHAYIHSNINGFLNILQGCRLTSVEHLVYASTSSVYGANMRMPFTADQAVGHPLSIYAATKRANELMAHSYSHLFGVPTTGLRFFTVYGPWGRPDMALFLFTRAILRGEPINVYNHGRMERDFTYIDDIVDGVVRVLDRVPAPDPVWNPVDPAQDSSGTAPFRVYNIGNSQSVVLTRYIEVLEQCLGRTARRNLMPMQPGDVPATWADTAPLEADAGYRPSTPVEAGVRRFVDWFLDFYGPDATGAPAMSGTADVS